MRFLRSQKGVTLLEVMLVLAIAGVIIATGLRVQQQRTLELNFEQLQDNVNQLFGAMALYYRINCRGLYNGFGEVVPGTLNPARTDKILSAADPYPINISTDLVDSGVLSAANGIRSGSWSKNPLVDNTETPADLYSGYVVQFNPIPDVAGTSCSKLNCGGTTSTTVPFPPNVSDPTNKNEVLTLKWTIQVAVKLKDPAMAATYKSILRADCISESYESTTDVDGIVVFSCDTNPTADGYLVWERLPAYATTNALSTESILSPSLPKLQQFNVMYTHDQMYELAGGDRSGATQFYLCGG